MITLCIMEQYYRIGMFRIERFNNMKEVESYRSKLDRRTQTWILGEPIPKKRQE